MYRNVPKNLFHNVWKCAEKTISKVIWVGKGALDAILSQINKKIGDKTGPRETAEIEPTLTALNEALTISVIIKRHKHFT